jgi:hypothetical protein
MKIFAVQEAWEDQEGSAGQNEYGFFSTIQRALDVIEEEVETDKLNTSKRFLAGRRVEIREEQREIEIIGGTYSSRLFWIKEYELDERIEEGHTDFVG